MTRPLATCALAGVLLYSAPVRAQQPSPQPEAPAEAPAKKTSQTLPPLDLGGLDVLGRELEAGLKPDEAAKKDGEDYRLKRATIAGRRARQAEPGSRYRIDVGPLDIVPRKDASEHLMMAPGVLTTNHGGEGHANETFLRGFNADLGQDIEFSVDGVPLNEVSHPHGHGYTDLFFMPPELVQTVVVSQGPFDPQQGDFAFAGSVDYRLGVSRPGLMARYGLGSFGTRRLVLTYAPEDQSEGTFAGAEVYQTSGYGQNRAAQRATGIGRYSWDDGSLRLSLTAVGYAARFDQAGVLRQEDVQLGRVGFYDTYDATQGGESNRMLLSFNVEAGPSTSRFEQVAFAGWRTMRLRTNFTGWTFENLEAEDGQEVRRRRGDGTEARYEVMTVGSRGSYRLMRTLWGRRQQVSMGYAARFDQGRTEQLRIRPLTSLPYARIFDNRFTILNLAGWARAQLALTDWLVVRGGVRFDAFSFGVRDDNPPGLTAPDADREGPRVPDQTLQSFGRAVNPRVTVEGRPSERWTVSASYGQGTRSTEATALSDNEVAPFALSDQLEAGAVYRVMPDEDNPWALRAQASYVYASVTRDLQFDEQAGRNVLIGGTTRHAAMLSARAAYRQRWDALLNVGASQATLDATGERLPYIPQLVVRLDTALNGQVSDWRLGGQPVTWRAGLGWTYVPGRPLPEQQVGDPFYLMSAGLQLQLWHAEVGVQARNLFNQQYRQSEFYYASDFDGPDGAVSKRRVRHFAAGEPRNMMLTLTLYLDRVLGEAKP